MGSKTDRTRTVGDGPAAPTGASVVLPERYGDEGPIGRGGMGEVRRVWDRRLQRRLAMKILHPGLAEDGRAAQRFLVEARMTAGLQHPGIVAVHDQGVLADGRPWLTMKEVRGRTFEDLLADPLDDLNSESLWLRRHLTRFASVCQTLAFAHARGVVHRDIKPGNLMVGEYGEVLVLDWGIARWVGDGSGADADRPDSAVEPGLTRIGELVGTPGYMAPEYQWAEPPPPAPTIDVYALGCVLYRMLSGRSPYVGTTAQVRRQVAAGPPQAVREVAETLGRHPPEELCALCERTMARDPADRASDASEVADALEAWLDGARRREQADVLLAEADALLPDVGAARDEAAHLRTRAATWLAEVQRHEPEDRKRPGWDLEDRADALERTAALREQEWVHRVRSALNLVSDLAGAHRRLADHYAARARRAESRRDTREIASMETLLRRHDDGRHAAFLRGDAALTLVTDPPGAEVTLYRYESEGRRRVARRVQQLGPTPLIAQVLPHGSYLVVAEAPGHAPLRYPVLLERAGHWHGRPPGGSEPMPVPLLRLEQLSGEQCYVPPGWFTAGGDPDAGDGLEQSAVWSDGFVIDRFPVTNADYIAFLDDLVDRGEDVRAESWSPRESAHGEEELPLYGRDAAGHFTLRTDRDGASWLPDWPVTMVSWRAAVAYASWRSERRGLPWRLPHDLEWAKAARGVDGRFYPWGDHGDPTWGRMAGSLPDRMNRAVVDSHPDDRSPYGVRGLGGNVRDWCLNAYRRDGPRIVEGRVVPASRPPDDDYRVIRGGCWASPPSSCRSAGRFANLIGVRSSVVGFRLVWSRPAFGAGEISRNSAFGDEPSV